MIESFPFYANLPGATGADIYHTHPRCRVAQLIIEEMREVGTGQGRHECPFCFMLGQFEANRAVRSRLVPVSQSEWPSASSVPH